MIKMANQSVANRPIRNYFVSSFFTLFFYSIIFQCETTISMTQIGVWTFPLQLIVLLWLLIAKIVLEELLVVDQNSWLFIRHTIHGCHKFWNKTGYDLLQDCCKVINLINAIWGGWGLVFELHHDTLLYKKNDEPPVL